MNIFRVRHHRIKTEENHALLKVDAFIHIKFFKKWIDFVEKRQKQNGTEMIHPLELAIVILDTTESITIARVQSVNIK